MADAIETNPRYKYVKRLADRSAERAKKLHLEYQRLDDLAHKAQNEEDTQNFTKLAASTLNDFFYWIGHSNAYRGIALQVDFMETVEAEEDAEPSCP